MLDTDSPFYTILSFDDDDSWDELLNQMENSLTERGLGHLVKLLMRSVKSIVIERQYIDKDYRDTFSHFHSKRFVTLTSRCDRLHFFSVPISRNDLRTKPELLQASYLGYSVIRPTRPNCIGRTLLSPKCRVKKLGYLAVCKESILLQDTVLEIEGFPFISQDVDATVCAESAIWMLVRYFSNRYSLYKERYPFEITKMAEGHAMGKRVYPAGGLTVWQISETLRLAGFSSLIYSANRMEGESDKDYNKRRKDFLHNMYTYIESGLPLILAVPRHVLVAMGHKSEKITSVTSGDSKFLFTSELSHSLIVNDDNIPAYQELKEQGGKTVPNSVSEYGQNNVEAFIVPLAEKVFLLAEDFKSVVVKILEGKDFGLTHSSQLESASPLVLRMFLTTGRSFKKKIAERNLGHAVVQRCYSEMPMPHFIWVCELSTVELYDKGEVLGEGSWDATRNAYEPQGFIAIHYPEILWVDAGAQLNGEQNLQKIGLQDANPYILYQSNLKEF